MPTIQRRKKTFDNSNNWLLSFASSATSICGEDGIILKVFEIIGVESEWCVEFGAWDGRQYSNTYNLITRYGWRGVLIEGDESRFHELQKTYGNFPKVNCVNRFVGFDSPDTLDEILSPLDIPRRVDLLSIDIDGNDYHVWKAVEDYRPRVVIIEFNPTIPNDVVYIQDRDMNVHQGNSLLALIELAKEKEYELVCATGWNAFFVLREYYDLFNIKDNSIDKMFDDQAFATRLFQLFDGTLEIAGQNKLMWAGIEFSSADIQVLPKHKRIYSDSA